MNIQDALFEAGVRPDTLTAEEKEHLDRDGYVLLEGILSPAQVESYRAVLERIMVQEGADAGKEVHQEAGTDRAADLINKDPLFEGCLTHPRVLAAVSHVLGEDLKLFAFTSRDALPGQGAQILHADGDRVREDPNEFLICNTIWLLDDFTPQNGPTRVVPGTHRMLKLPSQVLADPAAPHPDEVKVLAGAGSVVVFNSHMWHGGTANLSDRPRRAMFVAYCRRDQEQLTDQRKYLRPETGARLSPAARVMMDVD